MRKKITSKMMRITLLLLLLLMGSAVKAIDSSKYTHRYTDNNQIEWYFTVSEGKANIVAWEVKNPSYNITLRVPRNVFDKNNYKWYSVATIGRDAMEDGDFTSKHINIHLSFEQGSTAEIRPNCFEGFEDLKNADLTNYSGKTIPENCFSNTGYLESTYLPSKLESIGNQAFACSNISELDMTNTNIVNIGEKAFYKCSNLENISFSERLKEMGKEAFENCDKLTSVNFSHTQLTEIPDKCFNGDKNITSVDFGKKINKLGENAFSATGIRDLDLRNTNIKIIGNRCFEGCVELETVFFPQTLTTFEGIQHFSYCTKLITADFGSTEIKKIPSKCFYYCYQLHGVNFGKIEEIGGYAFEECYGLDVITFPENLKSIGAAAFHVRSLYPKSLSKVIFTGRTPPTSIGSMVFEGQPKTTIFITPVDCSAAYKKVMSNSNMLNVEDQTYEILQMNEHGYKSYYLDTENFKVPENTKAYIIHGQTKVDGKRVAKKTVLPAGSIIAPKTGFIIAKSTPGEVLYKADVKENISDYPTNNFLHGAPFEGKNYGMIDGTTENALGSGTYFVLALNPETHNDMGFYYQAGTKGKGMKLGGNQAGLFIPKGTIYERSALSFGLGFDDDETTGITNLTNTTKEENVIYDLQGRRVKETSKGLYIINGKKVLVN